MCVRVVHTQYKDLLLLPVEKSEFRSLDVNRSLEAQLFVFIAISLQFTHGEVRLYKKIIDLLYE